MPIRTDEIELLDGIYDSGLFIQLHFRGKSTWISKANIQAIRIIDNNTICLDNGDDPLKHIYIRLTDIAFPEIFDTATGFVNYVITFFSFTNVVRSDTKLDDIISELQQIKQTVQEIKGLMGGSTDGDIVVPTEEDSTQAGYIYKGYVLPNVTPKEASWRISRTTLLQVDAQKNSIEWADGNKNYDNNWDDRYTITYYPLDVVITPNS